jgi:hypothetical protein
VGCGAGSAPRRGLGCGGARAGVKALQQQQQQQQQQQVAGVWGVLREE